jgi:DNA repair protein RadA/Sms
VLYVSGEESLEQLAMRARRLELPLERLRVAAETRAQAIADMVEQHRPALVVVDSIQVMQMDGVDSLPGSVTQVRETAAFFTRLAKQSGTVFVLVGHVTKEGSLAGPKVLEHMIDCFMMLESPTGSRFRTLRGVKNRFGAVNELGVFAMTELGMKEVSNPSAIFLERGNVPAAGSLVTVTWEGTRPLLVELQALVDQVQSGYARRVAVGLDAQRLAMHLAVLHRHGGISLGDQDVFANVVGGVRIGETAGDLALILAVLSSFRARVLARDLVVFGELGLTGEVRPVPNGQERLREARKHGFARAIVPKANRPRPALTDMHVVGVTTLNEAIDAAFGTD